MKDNNTFSQHQLQIFAQNLPKTTRPSESNSLDNSEKLSKLKYSGPFRNIGRNKTLGSSKVRRSGFKNIK